MIVFELAFSKRSDSLGQQLPRVHLGEVVDLVLRQELAQVVRLNVQGVDQLGDFLGRGLLPVDQPQRLVVPGPLPEKKMFRR